MDQLRKERLHQLVRTLQSAQAHVHDLWLEQQGDFETRSPASKETDAGKASGGAVFDLEEATQHIRFAIEHLKDAANSADTKLA